MCFDCWFVVTPVPSVQHMLDQEQCSILLKPHPPHVLGSTVTPSECAKLNGYPGCPIKLITNRCGLYSNARVTTTLMVSSYVNGSLAGENPADRSIPSLLESKVNSHCLRMACVVLNTPPLAPPHALMTRMRNQRRRFSRRSTRL